jgi:hypothetical protein
MGDDMGDEAESLSGAEEYVSIEIELIEPLNPDAEKDLREALREMDAKAFDSCDIAPEKVSFCYDPTRTSRRQLLQLVQQAGGKLKHVESAASPLL